MSTQVLGNVNLITKEEVEAMLEAVVITEDTIDEKIEFEKEAREASENTITTALNQEKAQREADKVELDDKIADEAEIRDRRDEGLENDIQQEATIRQQGDNDILTAMNNFKEMVSETYPNAYATRLKGLPIATLTVHNTDKSLHIGDTIATVDQQFFPKQSVDFWMDVEQVDAGTSKTVMVCCRLDNHGNVNVINMFDFTGASSATDAAAITYFTEA